MKEAIKVQLKHACLTCVVRIEDDLRNRNILKHCNIRFNIYVQKLFLLCLRCHQTLLVSASPMRDCGAVNDFTKMRLRDLALMIVFPLTHLVFGVRQCEYFSLKCRLSF